MPLEEFAKLDEVKAAAQVRAVEEATASAREPFHKVWLERIYPAWQPHLIEFSEQPGITFAGSAAVNGSPDGLAVALPTQEMLDAKITEEIVVKTKLDVEARIAYVFSGSEDRGQVTLTRVGVRIDAGAREYELVKMDVVDAPTIVELARAAVADIGTAAAMVDGLLVGAVQAKQARLEREVREKMEAEAALAAGAARGVLPPVPVEQPAKEPAKPPQG